jgi:predicted PurR-regulated permease PerM
MSQIKDLLKDKQYMKYSLYLAVTATILYILYFIISNFAIIFAAAISLFNAIFSSLTPLFIGLILAYLINPLVNIIDKNFIRKILSNFPYENGSNGKRSALTRLLSILITYVVIIAGLCFVLYAFSVLILGQFVFSGIGNVVESITNYLSTYETVILSWTNNLDITGLSDTLKSFADSIVKWLSSNFSTSSIISFIGSIGGSIINILLGIIISIYLLNDQIFFMNIWKRFLTLSFSKNAEHKIQETLNDINGVVSLFIRGALLDALIVAILSSTGLSILGLQFAVFIGCFAGIANIIPYFGPVLGMIPAFIVGVFTGGLAQGILAVLILLIIQQIDANIIYPKIVGSTTGLHPLFVLLAVAIAASFAGILGMIIAVPTVGIIQIFILKWVNHKENQSPL